MARFSSVALVEQLLERADIVTQLYAPGANGILDDVPVETVLAGRRILAKA